jgi:hypothetical protein
MLTNLENKLITTGYDSFDNIDKNMLIQELSRKFGKVLNEITEEYILDYHKQIKLSAVNKKCEEVIVKGFTSSNGHTYRTNRDDQINMIGQKDAISDNSTITTVDWKTEDSGYITHSREEWMNVYTEAFTHKKTQLMKYNSLKESIANATTHDEIIAIVWE